MKYRLYDNEIDSNNVIEKVLWNRGIKDYQKYLSLDQSVEIPYNKLNNITKAVEVFLKHYENKDSISILVDSDPDGYTSAAAMYLYIKRLDQNYPVSYIMHKKEKAHGLSEDVVIPEGTKLLIIPDAGTNDYIQCTQLLSEEIIEDIIILDHHEAEINRWRNNDVVDHVTVVNNQMSENYTNKDLSGVGVVYKFLQALDEATWNEYADDYLDLVALGNISDVMNMTSFETRYYVNEGLKQINNKFFNALIQAQEFSMKGKVNIHNVQWYCTPVLNGCIRVGSNEERELLFKAMIEQDEFFEYKKRATKDKPAEVIQESIYDRAARLSKNAKSRQDKIRDKGVAEITKLINNTYNENNKVIMVDVSDILDNKGLTGVLAIKIAEMFNKPCILLKKFVDNGKIFYGGSARNIDNSPIESFKDIVNETGVFIYAQGHANAFGQCIELDKVDEANKRFNELLKDIKYDATYIVDYILDSSEIDPSLPIEMAQLDDVIAQGVSEPLVAIENITLTRKDVSLTGKISNTLKFTLPNGIEFVQFFCKDGMTLYDWINETWDAKDSITINIVGQPGVNDFMGTRTPQVVIKDVEIIDKMTIDEEEDIW